MQNQQMKIKDLMTDDIRYVKHDASVSEAAKMMAELDCGFLPISDKYEEKIQGVITDRDIVLRSVVEGRNPNDLKVQELKSPKAFYCYADDDIGKAVKSMQDLQIWRLIVLDNEKNKKLVGVISVGDILRAGQEEAAVAAAREISKAA